PGERARSLSAARTACRFATVHRFRAFEFTNESSDLRSVRRLKCGPPRRPPRVPGFPEERAHARRAHRRRTTMSMSKLLSVAALLGLATACNTNNTREEAREDVIEARSEARQDAAEAMRHDDPSQSAERVAEINQDLAESHKDAYQGVNDKAGAPAAGAVATVKYERFEALEDESDEAFLSRADSAIRRVE